MMADARAQGEAMLQGAGPDQRHEHARASMSPATRSTKWVARAWARDPRTSVLNDWSQAHDASNLYVTDGAQMASVSCVNPSLTFMALTARAADHAVKAMRA